MAQAIRICLHADCAADTVSAQQDQHAKVSVQAAAATDGDTQKADNPVPTAPQSEHQICQNCVRIHTIHWDSKYRPPEESCASLPARNPKPKEACSKERINTRTVWRAGLPQATHTNACLRRSCGLSATPHAPRNQKAENCREEFWSDKRCNTRASCCWEGPARRAPAAPDAAADVRRQGAGRP